MTRVTLTVRVEDRDKLETWVETRIGEGGADRNTAAVEDTNGSARVTMSTRELEWVEVMALDLDGTAVGLKGAPKLHATVHDSGYDDGVSVSHKILWTKRKLHHVECDMDGKLIVPLIRDHRRLYPEPKALSKARDYYITALRLGLIDEPE